MVRSGPYLTITINVLLCYRSTVQLDLSAPFPEFASVPPAKLPTGAIQEWRHDPHVSCLLIPAVGAPSPTFLLLPLPPLPPPATTTNPTGVSPPTTPPNQPVSSSDLPLAVQYLVTNIPTPSFFISSLPVLLVTLDGIPTTPPKYRSLPCPSPFPTSLPSLPRSLLPPPLPPPLLPSQPHPRLQR